MSAEYIMAGGNEQVILCERGIRTYETATRNTLDLSAIPVLHEKTHLPVIVDPSHATGVSRLVKPMALAAAACGADGLMIEVHNDPKHALCDGAQSLTPDEFADVARRVMAVLRPVRLTLVNYPEGQTETFEVENNPLHPEEGTHTVTFSRNLWVEAEDFLTEPIPKFKRLCPNGP